MRRPGPSRFDPIPPARSLGAGALWAILPAALWGAPAAGQSALERPIASISSADVAAARGWAQPEGDEEPGGPLVPGAEEVEPSRLSWTLQFEPRAWYAALAGDIRVPGLLGNHSIDLHDLELDDPDVRPAVRLSLKRDRWRITLGGFWIEEEATTRSEFSGRIAGRDFAVDTRLDSSVELASGSASAGYELIHYTGGPEEAYYGVESIVELIGGVRFYHLDVDVRAELDGLEASVGGDELFVEPFGGVRWDLELLNQVSIESEVTAGGFAGGSDYSVFSLDVGTRMAWRPTPNVGLLVGYRQLVYDLEQGEDPLRVEYGGSVAGLYAGLHLRF